MQTLSGIPGDLLERGCAEARRRCRFPSEIVPTIMATVGEQWEWRKQPRPTPIPPSHQIEAKPDDRPITVDELLAMPAQMVAMGRGQGWIEPETLAEFDRIMAERQA